MAKLSRKLDIKKPDKMPPFVMPEPNDDAAAFGWSLDRLRYPAEDATKDDMWPGKPIFQIDEEAELRDTYGFNIEFLNPKFLQVILDTSEKVAEATKKCAEAKYSAEARAALRKVIIAEFKDLVVPQMIERFKKVSELVADFYAARLAHLRTYGPEAG